MEKITKEQMFRSVSDLSSAIAQGMKEIANGDTKSIDKVKVLADSLHGDLNTLSEEYMENDKGVKNVVNAFEGIAYMADSVGNEDIYYCSDVYTAIAETILIMREKVFMEYYD